MLTSIGRTDGNSVPGGRREEIVIGCRNDYLLSYHVFLFSCLQVPTPTHHIQYGVNDSGLPFKTSDRYI